MHKMMYFYPENLKKNLGFASIFRLGKVTLNSRYFFLFGLTQVKHARARFGGVCVVICNSIASTARF